MSTITIFVLLPSSTTFSLKFPIHEESEDKMINPHFSPNDDKACGLFKQVPESSGRVFQGFNSFVGLFPWAVCLFKGAGRWIKRYDEPESIEVSNDEPDETIFELGPYDFSKKKLTIYVDKISFWVQFCTGSIINENWILTAAHCMMSAWEGNYFLFQAGSNRCLLNEWNEYTREVVVNRMNNHEHRTVWEHPNWIKARKIFYPWGYDVALVRLNDPYILPKGTYNNEPINRVCLHSVEDLPKKACLNNIYFSGYGLKYSPATISPNEYDPTSRLTWFKLFRTSPSHCETLTGRNPYRYWAACYSQILSQFDLGENPSKMGLSIDNETIVKNIPNTCPGDSGGPFVYYMKYDKSQPDPHNVLADGSIQEGYRAIILSTLFGSLQKKQPLNECDLKYWEGRRKFMNLFYINEPVWYKPIHVGPMIYEAVKSAFFNTTLATTANGHAPVIGAYVRYPNVSATNG